MKHWTLYFYPQNEKFKFFEETEIKTRYETKVEMEFSNHDPVDISIAKKVIKNNMII